jgi:hypothetical protein
MHDSAAANHVAPEHVAADHLAAERAADVKTPPAAAGGVEGVR